MSNDKGIKMSKILSDLFFPKIFLGENEDSICLTTEKANYTFNVQDQCNIKISKPFKASLSDPPPNDKEIISTIMAIRYETETVNKLLDLLNLNNLDVALQGQDLSYAYVLKTKWNKGQTLEKCVNVEINKLITHDNFIYLFGEQPYKVLIATSPIIKLDLPINVPNWEIATTLDSRITNKIFISVTADIKNKELNPLNFGNLVIGSYDYDISKQSVIIYTPSYRFISTLPILICIELD